jgi:polyhydroxybutyrate depolymerase
LRLVGCGCLSLVGLVLLCGALGGLAYRANITAGVEAASTAAAAQALPETTPMDERCAALPVPVAGETETVIAYGDLQRRYLTYVPPGLDAARPVPLVISLHGSGASPEQQRDLSQWNVFADAHGFVVVYPEAAAEANRTFISFPVRRLAPEVRPETDLLDVIFIRDVLSRVGDAHCVDPDRIYVTGFSAGGAMALFLSCRLPATFAAVGTAAAPYWADLDDPAWCPPVGPVPTIAFHGTADPVIPYDGGGPPFGYEYVPYERWTAGWAARNGCEAEPETMAAGEGVRVRRYRCPAGAEVTAYTVEDGGHLWPGGAPLLEQATGGPPAGIVATAEMWAFFSGERD